MLLGQNWGGLPCLWHHRGLYAHRWHCSAVCPSSRGGGTGKLYFGVSWRHRKHASVAVCIPDPSLESCYGPLLSCSVTEARDKG